MRFDCSPEIKQTVELRDWSISYGCAHGNVYGHPKFVDGTRVRTSLIMNVSEKDDVVTIETMNTIYKCRLCDKVGLICVIQ